MMILFSRGMRAGLTLLLVVAVTSGSPAQPTIIAGTDGKPLPAEVAPEPAFTLAILPDRTSGQAWGLSYLEAAVEDLNRIRPDAVFTIGDMVQGYTRSMERYINEVDEYLAITGRLQAPFYPLPGNHDVIAGTRDSSDRRFETEYQQRFGPLYYAVLFDTVSVIALYSDEQLQSRPVISKEQTEWAMRMIDSAVHRGRPIVVLMHKPLWRYRTANWEPLHQRLALAVERGVTVIVVGGHFHSLQRDPDLDGVQYHLVGTCGALIDQHPLNGQLQHFTIIKSDGADRTSVYHQAVGCTLPDDFVLADDQRRGFVLKTRRDSVVIETILDQPLGRPISGTVRIRVTNPIDVPITITGGLVNKEPRESIITGYGFFARTQRDIFNAQVSRVDTPFQQTGPVETLRLAAGETGYLQIPVRCDAQPAMTPPPEVDLVARFVDTRGRTVPIFIRRRLPLRMRYILTPEFVLDLPISAWQYSVYDRREQDPGMGLSAIDGQLNIALAVYDDVACYEPMDDATERINDPLSDAIRIRFGTGENEKVYLIEPIGPADQSWLAIATGRNQWRLEPAPRIQWSSSRRENGRYGVVIRIPLELIGRPGEEVPFNLEIADNDLDYHTQWRRWSHPRAGSVIVLPAQF